MINGHSTAPRRILRTIYRNSLPSPAGVFLISEASFIGWSTIARISIVLKSGAPIF
jgi:hypothetical protein